MHWTNGIIIIIIQMQSKNTTVNNSSEIPLSLQRHYTNWSFAVKPNFLSTYFSERRENQSHLTDPGHNGQSAFIDFLWILLRQKGSDVPMWTTCFNYQILNDKEKKYDFIWNNFVVVWRSVWFRIYIFFHLYFMVNLILSQALHKVYYLPAIKRFANQNGRCIGDLDAY